MTEHTDTPPALPTHPLRVAVMGAGGVGGFYGGRLARGGADVTFVARGAHLAALREGGLHVQSPLAGDFHLPAVQATDDPATVGPVDLVLFSVKGYDLDDAAQAIRPLVGPHTLVLPLLNGVDAVERIGAAAGAAHVLGGVTYVFASIAEPGTIRHVAADRVICGEPAGGVTPRVEALGRALAAAGVEVEVSADVQQAIWSKFIGLVATSGVTALTRQTIGPVREDPDTRALLVGSLREGEAVARALGVHLPADLHAHHVAFADGLPPESRSSLALDLLRGRRLEVESLQGKLVRLGRELGVPTPITEVIYGALKLHAAGSA